MSSNLSWEHQYCLSCDRQTDGATYCSESCRLSEFDKSSTSYSTPASSPGLGCPAYSWTSSRPQSKFILTPAYDFSNAQPYGSSPRSGSHLTPSSSYSSLNSLQSTSSATTESKQLSEKARKQLRDYAISFEQARLQRRRSC